MSRIYFDNAATSYPKPPAVTDAIVHFSKMCGASPGRGAYAESRLASSELERCRNNINTLINGENPKHVIFTLNTTDALNLAIYGIYQSHLKSTSSRRLHMVSTVMDHNSVLRPFHALKDQGVDVTFVEGNPQSGLVDPDKFAAALTPQTCLAAVIHGSNVTGTVQNIAAIGDRCRSRQVPLLVDAAQTIGHQPIDVQAMGIDLLAFPGHKGLLGPLGTGGLYIRPGVEPFLEPYRQGGTGSASEAPYQPMALPDKFECGSHNTLGLIGLSEAITWIRKETLTALWRQECIQIEQMLNGLRKLDDVQLLGPQGLENRCGVFSIMVNNFTPQEVSEKLEQDHGVLTRSGLHCAPFAHQQMGSSCHNGATRLSLGPFLTTDNIEHALHAISEISRTTSVVAIA
jgi:cysteine desulfurase family protein